jgi:Tfp pilus assembly protein PilE
MGSNSRQKRYRRSTKTVQARGITIMTVIIAILVVGAILWLINRPSYGIH